MTSFREDVLQIANDVRRDVPASLDLRQQHKVEIVTRTWVGGQPGAEGGYSDSVVELVERYKVRQLSTREVLASGGKFEQGDIRVGPITPDNGNGVGYTVAQLAPQPTTNAIEVIYQLSGPHEGKYRRVEFVSIRDTGWFLTLRRRMT